MKIKIYFIFLYIEGLIEYTIFNLDKFFFNYNYNL